MSYPDPYDTAEKLNTQRERPGRSGLAAPGPPPRSTGILRMWRKDERGRQWTRVGRGSRTRSSNLAHDRVEGFARR